MVRMVCAYKLLIVRKKKFELFLHFGLRVCLELMLCFKNKETECHLVNPKTKGRQGYGMGSNDSHHRLIKI